VRVITYLGKQGDCEYGIDVYGFVYYRWHGETNADWRMVAY
jgi:hypothetical protein